ncbi:MAG TPA: ADP-ribosylglycohydrolase [Gammaproteobacteria bacterium]|nr:ADP-ribosylglycohydrolase [Gammaproteobacteria bacterium]
MIDREQRYQGCLTGLATGDAVGTTLEFQERGSFTPITDLVGGGPFNLQAGQWTDDTSMALCLAHSLLDADGFDADDQMHRYCAWRSNGYMSSTGRCFDIGVTVSESISQYLKTGDPFSGSSDPFSAGNGSLMRLAPVAMYYSPDLESVIHYCGLSSRTTHGDAECIDACRYFGTLLHAAFGGLDKQALLQCDLYQPETKKVAAIQAGSYRNKHIQQIRGSGYVIDCLEASLWCFANTGDFASAILAAANLGDDADTTAAVCGQIAGAYYGWNGIPQSWRERLTMGADIRALASGLMNAGDPA